MATIRPRSGSWNAYWRHGGGGRTESTTWPTERLAIRAARYASDHAHRVTADEVYAAIYRLDPPVPDAPRLPTVSEWADTWIGAKTRAAPHTLQVYRQHLRDAWLPAIGERLLDQVSGADISAVIKDLQAMGRSPATITRYYATIHGALAYAVAEGVIASNPARRTDFVRDAISITDAGDAGEDHVYLTADEVDRIIRCADGEIRAMVWLLAYSGMRYSEASAVAVGAVDLVGRAPARVPTIRCHRAWHWGEGRSRYLGSTKGRTRRTLGLPTGETRDVLGPLLAGRDPDLLLVDHPERPGEEYPYDRFYDRLWWAATRAMRCPQHPPMRRGRPDTRKDAVSTCGCVGVLSRRPSPHDLRHTHCSWLLAAGHPILYVSRRLGHKTTAVTETVYAGIMPDVAEGMAADLGRDRAEPPVW